jgi:hypothetical protein
MLSVTNVAFMLDGVMLSVVVTVSRGALWTLGSFLLVMTKLIEIRVCKINLNYALIIFSAGFASQGVSIRIILFG